MLYYYKPSMRISSSQQKNRENKHCKYENTYKPNTLYWGLGIENEVYLEICKKNKIKTTDILVKQKSERYSLDYYLNYKKYFLSKGLIHFISATKDNDFMEIPYLVNSHSFTKTDIYNQPTKLYTKECNINPLFCGETFIETLQKKNSYFGETFDKYWLFDGDAIEFNTINFFNASLHDVVRELEDNKKTFINELNKTLSSIDTESCFYEETFSIMKKNYAFATYMTNSENIAIFNNGTLHYNLTLPTQLDNDSKILDWDKFVDDHKKAIRAIQWIEPFYLSYYCSPDPFSKVEGFSKASQRCAVSRYIGIGTYDSDTMETGKILSKPIKSLAMNDLSFWWYHKFSENNAYAKLNDMGMDINFNKHYNHGVEIRFIDHIEDENALFESFEFIIYLMDFVLESDRINDFGNPTHNLIWNKLTLNSMVGGKECFVSEEERKLYSNIFNFEVSETSIGDIYKEIYNELKKRYYGVGKFSRVSLKNNLSTYPHGNRKEGCFLCCPPTDDENFKDKDRDSSYSWVNIFMNVASYLNLSHLFKTKNSD